MSLNVQNFAFHSFFLDSQSLFYKNSFKLTIQIHHLYLVNVHNTESLVDLPNEAYFLDGLLFQEKLQRVDINGIIYVFMHSSSSLYVNLLNLLYLYETIFKEVFNHTEQFSFPLRDRSTVTEVIESIFQQPLLSFGLLCRINFAIIINSPYGKKSGF
jgi:hypothetical protein